MPDPPFWEDAFERLDAPDPFGPPAEELEDLVPLLPSGAAVLDLGCGQGRNALYLAQQGFRVTAVDVSEAAIRKLIHRAHRKGVDVQAAVQDLRTYAVRGVYDLIVAHGVLHLMQPDARNRLVAEMQAHTASGGYNVAVVFTNALPPPEGLGAFMIGLFDEGEIFAGYAGWRLLRRESYILDDEHPGGVRHRHPVNKLVAQKLAR
jgi:tellurite methyltransferase